MSDISWLVPAIGYVFIVLGLVGAVIPVLPGPIFVWLGAFLWAWDDGFVHVGWPTLTVLAILTLVAWGSDLSLSLLSSRRAGAGWRSIGVAILGGVAGAILLSPLPIVGTVFGAALGAVAALWYAEYRRQNDRDAATRAVRGYIGGFLLAMLVELTVVVVMIAIFAWQAFGA